MLRKPLLEGWTEFALTKLGGHWRGGWLDVSDRMKFTVNSVSSGARSGSLILGETLLGTPCLLLSTRKGLPAYITPDLLETLHIDPCALQISPIHFVDNPSPTVVAAIGGAHKILCQPKRVIVAIARDSLGYEADGEKSTKFGASFETPNGRRLDKLQPKMNSEATTTNGETRERNKRTSGTTEGWRVTSYFRSGTSTSVLDTMNLEMITPKSYMEGINALKPDLWAALPDEVPAWVSEKRNRVSVDRTLLWLDECLSLHAAKNDPVLGVVVGGASIDERKRSAQATALRSVSGFSLGGFGLGESPESRQLLLEAVITDLPAHKVRHVSGLGMPEEVLHAVSSGVDLFDSIYPDILTEEGLAMTFPFSMEESNDRQYSGVSSYEERANAGADSAKINLFSVTHRNDMSPIVKGCQCYTCCKHTRAYIHHLLNVHEMLAQTLLNIHNYHHYLNFFAAVRKAIVQDEFQKFRHWFVSQRRDMIPSDALRFNKS